MFNGYFIENFTENVPLEELHKSVNVWQCYDQNPLVYFFDSRCVLAEADKAKMFL